jgi:hypothetical protein
MLSGRAFHYFIVKNAVGTCGGAQCQRYCACVNDALEVLRCCTEQCGTNIDAVVEISIGAPPLHIARAHDKLEIVQDWVEMAGTDMHGANNHGATPLQYNLTIVKLKQWITR